MPEKTELSKKGYIGLLDIFPFVLVIGLALLWYYGGPNGQTAVIATLLASNTLLYFIAIVLTKNLNTLHMKMITTLKNISNKVSGVDLTEEF